MRLHTLVREPAPEAAFATRKGRRSLTLDTFASGITHTFDGAHNLTLFRNLRRVVAPGGGVAVVTFLRDRDPITALFAVQMMVNDNGGDTHTEAEYRAWLGDAGFSVDDHVLDLPAQGARSVLFAT